MIAEFDIEAVKDRTLNDFYRADYYLNQCYQYPFDLSEWTGATLQVRIKPNDTAQLILTFSTTDGSILLSEDGVFYLIKSATQMNVRAGDYFYDMFVSNGLYPKKAFAKGRFIIQDNVSK